MASESMVSLASSIHAGPKTFALLIGSGVSASSGVQTGWHVTLDLVRRLAVLRGEDAGVDPVSWYRDHADGDPDYSALLSELAPSPVDRRNLLKPYFEPTEEERAEGLKLPTKAHNAIAGMVAGGFIKVIVTTNFDRLLEASLAMAGVQPNIISSPAHAAGAMPIAHSECSILKVHGDYLSPDLKNTVDELGRYDPAVDRLLDEVFDQYGLVICGWSGKWDTALRNAILRSPGRRFATYWFHREPLAPEAQEILNHRDAIAIPIQDADTAFDSLADKVEGLADAIDQRPQDTSIAVAQLKKYLPDPVHRIKLHDLVDAETANLIDRVRDLSMEGIRIGNEQYAERMRVYEEATAGLLKLLATGAFFSDGVEHDRLWTRCVEQLATQQMERSGITILLNMRQYPTLLALYAIGLGSVAADRLEPIAHALGTIKVRELNQTRPVGVSASSWAVLRQDEVKKSIADLERRKTPISDHLLDVLRPAVSDIIRKEERLEELFDEVEYLMGLAYAASESSGEGMGPVERAAWRSWPTDQLPGAVVDRHKELLIREGVFQDTEQFAQTRQAYDKVIREISWRM